LGFIAIITYARFEFIKRRGQIHVPMLAMLGKKSNDIIELNNIYSDMVYTERHKDGEIQAQVADGWMMSAYFWPNIDSFRKLNIQVVGILDRTKIGKPEGMYYVKLHYLGHSSSILKLARGHR
jgi:hypothetical protein